MPGPAETVEPLSEVKLPSVVAPDSGVGLLPPMVIAASSTPDRSSIPSEREAWSHWMLATFAADLGDHLVAPLLALGRQRENHPQRDCQCQRQDTGHEEFRSRAAPKTHYDSHAGHARKRIRRHCVAHRHPPSLNPSVEARAF